MARWPVVAAVALAVTAAVVLLARASADVVLAERDPGDRALSPRMLLANALLSHALFAGVLVAGVWYAGVPLDALGVGPVDAADATLGVAVGGSLYVGDEAVATAFRRAGHDVPETLRERLAPGTTVGWVALLAVVLPTVAAFEELLFRGVLVGALAAGFPVPAVALAVASSLAFGLAHGAQGAPGMVVATLLGLVLAGVFLVTGSLAVVVVAHYVVNALEFVVHERDGGRTPS